MQNSKENFVEERKKLNVIISFLEFSLKTSTSLRQVLDEENKPIFFDKTKLNREQILDFLKNLYALYTILIIADLTRNKNLIETLEKLKFKFATCLENITENNIDEIFKCIPKDKNSFREVLFISGYDLAYGLELKLSLGNNAQTSNPFVEIRVYSKNEEKLNFLLQKAWYHFLNDKEYY